MTVQRGFSRTAAVLAVGLAIGVCAMLLATGARAKPAAGAASAAACHITLTHSVGGGAATKVRWVNDSTAPIGVYWLNYTGFLVYYESIAPHASFTQSTFPTPDPRRAVSRGYECSSSQRRKSSVK